MINDFFGLCTHGDHVAVECALLFWLWGGFKVSHGIFDTCKLGCSGAGLNWL